MIIIIADTQVVGHWLARQMGLDPEDIAVKVVTSPWECRKLRIPPDVEVIDKANVMGNNTKKMIGEMIDTARKAYDWGWL